MSKEKVRNNLSSIKKYFLNKNINKKSFLVLFFAIFLTYFSFFSKTFSTEIDFENEYKIDVNEYSFKKWDVNLKNFQIFDTIEEFRLKSYYWLPDYVLKKWLTSSKIYFYRNYLHTNDELSMMQGYWSQFFVIIDPSRYRQDNKLTIKYDIDINFYWDLEDLENPEKLDNNTCLYIDFLWEDKKKLNNTCFSNLLTAEPFILFWDLRVRFKSPNEYLRFDVLSNDLKYQNWINEIEFQYATSYVKDSWKRFNSETNQFEDTWSWVIMGINVPRYNIVSHNIADHAQKYYGMFWSSNKQWSINSIHRTSYNNLFSSDYVSYLSGEKFFYLYTSSIPFNFSVKFSNWEFKPYSINWLSESSFENFEWWYIKKSQIEPKYFNNVSDEYYLNNEFIYWVLRFPSRYTLEQFSALIMYKIYWEPKDLAIWKLVNSDRYKDCEFWDFACSVLKNLWQIPTKPETWSDWLPIDKAKTSSWWLTEWALKQLECDADPECVKEQKQKDKEAFDKVTNPSEKDKSCWINIWCYIQSFTSVFSWYTNFMRNDFFEILKTSFSNLFSSESVEAWENDYNLITYDNCGFLNIFCHLKNSIKFFINIFISIFNKILDVEPFKFIKNVLTWVYNFFEPLFKIVYKVATFQYDFNTLFWGDQNFVCSNLPNWFFQEYMNFETRKPLESLWFLWFFINPFPPQEWSQICTSLWIKQINYGKDTILDWTIFLFFFISWLWFPFIFLNKSK